MLSVGISCLAWFFWGLAYRWQVAGRYEIGMLDVDMPQWHEQSFWVLLILLILSWVWFYA